MEIVFDSSTLILLAKVEILTLVSEDIQITIPEKVKPECTGKDRFDEKLNSSLIVNGKIKVIGITKKESVEKLCKDFKIRNGEAEALALALKRKLPQLQENLSSMEGGFL